MYARATKHCNHGLLPRLKEKENYLHGKAPNKQKKKEKSFWVFSKGHKTRKQENENKLAWIIQWQSVNTD